MSEFLDLVNNLRTSNQQVAISSSADPANDFGNDAVRNVAIALQTGQQANSVNFDLAKCYITRFCDSSVSSSLLYNVSDAAKPSFNYARNSISIPSRSANPGLYNDKGAFYNQIFHEVSHYTRAQLGISGVISGTPEYQKEEVIAEMTACKMMMNCGFPVANLRTSARYIDAWANEYVKNLPEAEKAAAKAELLSDAEKSADEALKLVHLNIGMNQRYEMNQDLKMRLIVPADEVKLALARGVRQDEKGYYVRISDDFSKFERWSEKNMLETAIQYSRKAVNEAAPEIRQDKENELNTAIQEAQKQAEAEEAQKASVVTSSADNIDQREEISVASSEQSNAPNVPDSNSVNASLIAEIQRMQQQLAELQKQLAATQKENEELRNGQQRAENAGRAGENSANRNDIKHTDDEAGTGSMEMERGHFQDGGSEPLEGIQPEMGGEDISGLRSRSGSISAGRSRNAGSMGSDRSNALSGEDGGSIGNHTHAGSRRSGGAEENEGTDDADRLSESRNVSTESDRHVPGRNRDGSVSGRRSSGTLSADGTQEQVRSGNNFRQGDVSGSEHSDNDGIHGIRDRSGNVDLSMVDKARSGAPEEAVLPGEHTGARGETAGVSPVSGNTGFESVNRGSDAGVFQSAGGGARRSVQDTGAPGDDDNSLSDGAYGNERAENADSVSAGSSQLVEESGLRRSGELQGEHGRGQVLHDRGDVTSANNNANEPDAQEVRPLPNELIRADLTGRAASNWIKAQIYNTGIPVEELVLSGKLVTNEGLARRYDQALIEEIDDTLSLINDNIREAVNLTIARFSDIVNRNISDEGLSFLEKIYYGETASLSIEQLGKEIDQLNDEIKNLYLTHESELTNLITGYLAETEKAENTVNQTETQTDGIFPRTQEEYDSLRNVQLSEQEKHDAVEIAVTEWVSWQENPDSSAAVMTEQTSALINTHEQHQQFENILIDRVTEQLSEAGWASLAQFARTPVESPFYDASRYEALEEVLDEIDVIYREHEAEINNSLTPVNEQQADIQASQPETSSAPAEKQETQNNSETVTDEYFLKNVIYHSILECVDFNITEGNNQLITAKMYLDGTLHHQDIKDSTERKLKDHVDAIYDAIKNVYDPRGYDRHDEMQISNAVREFLGTDENLYRNFRYVNNRIVNRVIASVRDNHLFNAEAMQEIIGEMHESHSGYPTYDDVLANLAKLEQSLSDENTEKADDTVNQPEPQKTAQKSQEQPEEIKPEESQPENTVSEQQDIPVSETANAADEEKDPLEDLEYLYRTGQFSDDDARLRTSVYLIKNINFVNHPLSGDFGFWSYDFNDTRLYQNTYRVQAGFQGTSDEIPNNFSRYFYEDLNRRFGVTQNSDAVKDELEKVFSNIMPDLRFKHQNNLVNDELPEIKEKRAKKSRKKKDSDQIDLFDDAQNQTEMQETAQHEPVTSSAVSDKQQSEAPEASVTDSTKQEPAFSISDNWEIPEEDNTQTEKPTSLERFNRNISAIETLRKIQNEGDRAATKEEQAILAQFSGWGGLLSHLHLTENSSNADKERYEKLRTLLGDEEFNKAQTSALTAFYTDPEIARTIYKGLEQAGFKGGNILEPSCGTGVFFGVMPREMMANSELHGIELEPITGAIAQKLYPSADIRICGYEKSGQQNNNFDVVIGNVPFGNFSVTDPRYMKDHDDIHNYFINKSLDQVKPGGIVAVITSSATLEDKDPAFREKIAEKAELMGAIRLPDYAFQNSGTDVKTDILFLKKRKQPIQREDAAKEIWVNTKQFEYGSKGYSFQCFDRDSSYDGDEKSRFKSFKINRNWMIDHAPSSKDITDEYGRVMSKEQRQREKAVDKINLPTLNEYYRQNSDMIIGGYESVSFNRYGQVSLDSGSVDNLKEELTNSLNHITGIFEAEKTEKSNTPKLNPWDFPDVKPNSFFLLNDKAYFKGIDDVTPVASDFEAPVKSFINLKNSFDSVINGMINEVSDNDLSALQQTLRDDYYELRNVCNMKSEDKDLPLFSIIGSGGKKSKNKENAYEDAVKFLKKDVSFGRLQTLEITDKVFETVINKKGIEEIKTKVLLKELSPITSKRTLNKQEIVHASTSNEALYLSLGNKGVVDFDYMSKISSISPAALVKELQDGGQIFRDPSKHGSMYENWIPKEEFLSGDIIDKIDQTRKRMNEDLSFEKELSALKKVLPQEKKFDEMDISISSPFVPTDIVGRFLDREFDGYGNKVVKDGSGKFHVDIGVNDYSKVKSYTVDGLDLDDVVQKFLNHDIIKNDCVKNDENAFRTVNHIYRKRFEEHFDNFVKNELTPDDKKRIENNYNKSLNRNVPRKYDGTFLNFAGMNTDKIKLRTHQINTVARGIFGGNTMIAHEVGAGKTYTMIATAMEMKRMGICKKPVITVPNAVLDQWEKDFHDLYPQANVLKVTSEDMKSENIVSTAAKMAYNDWDAIIISHKNLQKIPVSQSVIDMVKTRRQDEILEVAESSDLGIRAERKWIEQENDNLEKLITNIQNKYKDSGCPLTIDEIGIDRLFVDESHMYKNLPIDTTMGSIVGLSKGGSALAQEMEFKTAYFNEKTNYKGVIFASGTPVSNTLGEMYSLQKFLQPQVLRKAGITNFHIWTDNFVNIELDKQVNMTGQGLNVKLVMKEFKNLDGLLNMFWQTGDFVTTKSLVGKEGFVLPDVERESVIIEPTQGQENLINAIEQRMAVIEAGNVDPKKDNKLCVAGDSRKIGLDPRLLSDANLDRMNMTKSEAGKGVKIEKVAENVFNIWEETKEKRSTQVIFCDLGTPKKKGKKSGNQFTVYDELKQQFIDRGVPANEIALIHDYDDDAKKEILFQSVNKGDIRIVIGSTEKLGTGCNFQKKLIAAHHVDAPWRPSDFTQREGRIVRQKNENKTVKIFTYATKKTFDAYMFDTLARKQEYISALFSGQEKSRRIEDLKDVKLDYKKMRTITCGSEKLKAKLDLMDLMEEYVNAKKTEEQKLKNLSDNTLFAIPNRINACNSNIAKLEHVSDIKNANPIRFNEKKEKIFPGFRKPDGTFIDDKKEFMDYLTSKAPTDSLIGNYRGFPVYLYERRDDTGKMARKVAIAPSEFEERVPMMRYGNDVANITAVFPAIDNNWDHRIDYFEYQLNESREQLAKFEKELQDSDLSKKSIEKEIQHYDDLINECSQKLSELDAEELDEKAFVDINNVDPSSLKDVACEEEEETEESNYSLPEGYEEQYYEPAEQEALDLMPEEDKRHYIDVPFNEKNEAKALGAKWDQENKGWYVPEGVNMADFAKWPEKQKSEMPARDYIKVPMKDKDEAKALGARWDKDNKLWFIPKNANADLFAKWPRTTIAEKKAEQERKPVYSPRVTLYVPFSRKDEAKKLGAYWDARSKQWTCKAEDKAKFSEFLKPLPKTESKVRENTDRINHEPNVQSAMLRDLASAGVRIDAVSIQNTGKWIRVPLIDDKPGEKTGMLAIHLDGVPTMKFVNFRHPELSIPMNTENKVRLYVGDLEQIKQSPQAGDRLKTVTEEARARIAANQAAREAEREKAQKSAQAKSEYFSKMPTASENSQYLVSKGIKPSPDLHQNQKSGDLFVPFYDADGKIKTTQIIHADGRKQFIEGGQKGGSFHPLDGIQSLAERDTIYICEGYATANTIREATKEKMAVVAAGDCGNLLSVATAIHEKFPEKAIVIAGDDDRFNEVNSGRNHAESTARAIGATVVFPDFDGNSTGTDFNDMAKEKGIEAVRDVLRNEYRQHRSAAEEAAPENQPEKAKKPGYRR